MTAPAWTAGATEALPPRLQEFVRLIGPGPTLKLVEICGGTRIYIPAKATEDHQLAELIGLPALQALCEFYSTNGVGTPVLVPNAKRAMIAARDAQIRADAAAGSTARDLAIRHRLNERHITRILAAAAVADDRQAPLFG